VCLLSCTQTKEQDCNLSQPWACVDHPNLFVQEEAAYKLLKVVRQQFGKGGVPYIATHDGRTIRYPDPDIKVLLRRSPVLYSSSICIS
jgi:hypothetical protein